MAESFPVAQVLDSLNLAGKSSLDGFQGSDVMYGMRGPQLATEFKFGQDHSFPECCHASFLPCSEGSQDPATHLSCCLSDLAVVVTEGCITAHMYPQVFNISLLLG